MGSSVKIDGYAVRSLREQKELTQLYLATVVGVTTDTISRWENKKYPAIKLENAQKLAEALEVALEDILEKKTDEQQTKTINKNAIETQTLDHKETAGEFIKKSSVQPPKSKKKVIFGGLAVCFLLAVVLIYIFFGGVSTAPVITAKRFLPEHTAPGLSFPVIIRLHADASIDLPILIREEIKGKATAQNIDEKKSPFDHTPRWIGRLRKGETAFLYMVFPEESIGFGERVHFSGDCVSGKVQKSESKVMGNDEVRLMRYHWADKDRDYRVSDNEILDAYETFTFSGDVEFDFSELEEYWLAGKYYWDEQQKRLYPGAENQ